MRPARLAAVLVLASRVLTQGAELQPWHLPPGDLGVGAAPGAQLEPRNAAGADRVLCVWSDRRTSVAGQQGDGDLYACRMFLNGAPIDRPSFAIRQEAGFEREPRIAWNGASWLVAWEEQTPAGFGHETRVRATRVSVDGELLDDPPLSLFTFADDGDVVVAANGGDWLVVAQGFSVGEGGLRARRVSAQGAILDPTPVVLVPGTFARYHGVELVAAGADWLLAWQGQGVDQAQRFAPDLTPIGSTLPLPTTTIGSNGSDHLIVWPTGGELRVARVAPDGTMLDPGGIRLATATGLASPLELRVAWDGATWWASWRANVGILAARITTGGIVLDPEGVLITGATDVPRDHAVCGVPGGGVQVVWRDERAPALDPGDVYGVRVSASARPAQSLVVALGRPAQLRPALAPHANGYLAVVESHLGSVVRIQAYRLDPFGESLDPAPLELAAGPRLAEPAVAASSTVLLVVWSDGVDVLGRRLRLDGTPIDPTPVRLLPGASPHLAELSGVFLIVASGDPAGGGARLPLCARVRDDGTVLDPTPIVLGGADARRPRATALGGRWLVTWQRGVSPVDPGGEVRVGFVDANGSVGPSFAVAAQGGTPDVAASRSAALVVWRTGMATTVETDIAARLIGSGGGFISQPFAITVERGSQRAPAVAWNVREFAVCWEDARRVTAGYDDRTDLLAARVDTGGRVLDPVPILVGADPTADAQPALAALDGTVMFGGALFRGHVPFATYRLGVRALSDWSTLAGTGLTGTNGVPTLTGVGRLMFGATVRLRIEHGRPAAQGLHVIGFQWLGAPFLGGTFVPAPEILLPFALDAAGSATESIPIPIVPVVGLPGWVQSWVVDPGAPNGFAATPAIATRS